MVRRIRTDLNRGSSHDTRIKEAIIDAIARFGSHRFGFNQKRSQTVLISAQEILSLPTGWVEVDYLRLEHDDDRYPLQEVSYDWIEDEQQGRPDTGQPTHFAIHHRLLRMHPIPDKSYTLVMSLLTELPEISISAADDATNSWMTEGEELIRKQATGDLMVNYIGGSIAPQGLALLAEVENRILPNMEMRSAREQTSGRIRAFL